MTAQALEEKIAFYGYKSYNLLVNPINSIVRTVLNTMIESAGYFFLAMNPNGGVTAFRSGVQEDNLVGPKNYQSQIKDSTTNYSQCQKALSDFKKKPQPDGIRLNWICRENEQYLGLMRNRLELTPPEDSEKIYSKNRSAYGDRGGGQSLPKRTTSARHPQEPAMPLRAMDLIEVPVKPI